MAKRSRPSRAKRRSQATAARASSYTVSESGFIDEVIGLYPSRRGELRPTNVRRVYASSPSHDSIGEWLSLYSPEERVFGLDTEWRPNSVRGQDNSVALLQIAGKHGCLLIQMQRLHWLPTTLLDFLRDPNVTLTGMGIDSDCDKLCRHFNLKIHATTIDLGERAAEIFGRKDLKRVGLPKLCSEFLGEPAVWKEPHLTRSDWEAEYLSREQVVYAASDALCSYLLLEVLEQACQTSSLSTINTKSSPAPEYECEVRDVCDCCIAGTLALGLCLLCCEAGHKAPTCRIYPTSTIKPFVKGTNI